MEPDQIQNRADTERPLSRQRKWQLRKEAAGLCVICGRRKAKRGRTDKGQVFKRCRTCLQNVHNRR